MNLLLVVAIALFDHSGRVLVAQRPIDKEHGGLWEFPGGKVEAGEVPEIALVREIREELGIEVDPTNLAPAVFASEARGDGHLVLLLYRCSKWSGTPRAIDATAIRWIDTDDLAALDMPPADRPLASALAAERGRE